MRTLSFLEAPGFTDAGPDVSALNFEAPDTRPAYQFVEQPSAVRQPRLRRAAGALVAVSLITPLAGCADNLALGGGLSQHRSSDSESQGPDSRSETDDESGADDAPAKAKPWLDMTLSMGDEDAVVPVLRKDLSSVGCAVPLGKGQLMPSTSKKFTREDEKAVNMLRWNTKIEDDPKDTDDDFDAETGDRLLKAIQKKEKSCGPKWRKKPVPKDPLILPTNTKKYGYTNPQVMLGSKGPAAKQIILDLVHINCDVDTVGSDIIGKLTWRSIGIMQKRIDESGAADMKGRPNKPHPVGPKTGDGIRYAKTAGEKHCGDDVFGKYGWVKTGKRPGDRTANPPFIPPQR
ncbi:MAG TPA: hypothetical protein VF572_05770 [Candidatus Saccharimonadales bacterium]|jgi:hypothetical protein